MTFTPAASLLDLLLVVVTTLSIVTEFSKVATLDPVCWQRGERQQQRLKKEIQCQASQTRGEKNEACMHLEKEQEHFKRI
jgi:hypothetical protein